MNWKLDEKVSPPFEGATGWLIIEILNIFYFVVFKIVLETN
jgi:hypothetical protein